MRVLIVDRNECVQATLKKIIMETDLSVKVETCSHYDDMHGLLEQHVYSVVFLDVESTENVEANQNEGIETAERLSEKYSDLQLILMSSKSEHILKSFTAHPYDFLLKPMDLLYVQKTCQEVLKKCQNRPILMPQRPEKSKKLFIRSGKEILLLPYEQILFIEKVSKEILVHTEYAQYAVRQTLSELEANLPSAFVRVHKSYIVNMEHISRISEIGDRTYEIAFGNLNKTALVSRYKVVELFERLELPFKE